MEGDMLGMEGEMQGNMQGVVGDTQGRGGDMQGTQGTQGTLEDGHQGWLADSSHPSACNRVGSPNPNSWRQSQRVPRPPWSLWVSGQRDGGCWAGVAGPGGGGGGAEPGGAGGALPRAPRCARSHAAFLVPFLPLPVLSSRRRLLPLSAALWAPLPMSPWPLSPCPHGSLSPVSQCPHTPMPTYPRVSMSPCPVSLYLHAHLPLSQ